MQLNLVSTLIDWFVPFVGSEYLFMWLAIIISFLSYLAIWMHVRISEDSKNLTREEKSVIKNTVRAIGWYPVGEMSSCNNSVMI